MNIQPMDALVYTQSMISGIIAFLLFRAQKARSETWLRTWGEVIDFKIRSGGEGSTKHPVIQYKTISGEDAIFESAFGSSSWKFNVGDRLEIIANPNDPSDAQIVSFMTQWLIPGIFAVAAIGGPIAFFFMGH